MWFHEDGETADEIAERLRRDPTAIRRFLKHGQIEASRNGRPRALSEEQIDRLVKLVKAEVKKAGTEYPVTAELQASWLPACSGVMGPRAQVGMSSSAPNIRGVPETHFWRECIHILPKVKFCTVDGQWTDSGRYSGR